MLVSHLGVRGATVERDFRLLFGNTPDVSKALRLLVHGGLVRRAGGGGKNAPFVYTLRSRAPR